MATELHTFTGNEVIATELPELLNQNFDYVRENSLKSVNGVEKDENNNVDVTFLTSQVIPTNSDLNNFRESGEYTRELDTIVVTNSPTEKPFFLTVLASENLVKQVVTEIDKKDPMTFTRTLSGANWSPWVEGGVDIGIWKSEETVKVGDVRFLKGRENAGYVLECVTAGVTGENQPVLEGDIAEEVFDLNNFDGTLNIEKGGTGGELFIKDASISGKTITLKFADNSTKTLTTQDTNTGSDMTDYIIESYRNGTEWYEVYKSGKVRQGGITQTTSSQLTPYNLLKPYSNTNYFVIGNVQTGTNNSYGVVIGTKTTTTFKMKMGASGVDVAWIAEGQGA